MQKYKYTMYEQNNLMLTCNSNVKNYLYSTIPDILQSRTKTEKNPVGKNSESD